MAPKRNYLPWGLGYSVLNGKKDKYSK